MSIVERDSIFGEGVDICMDINPRTPKRATLLEVINPLAEITLVQLFAHQPGHHALDPLLANDGIARILEGAVVVVVDSVEGWRDCGLFG